MRLTYTRYTKEAGDGQLEFGFTFPVQQGVPTTMLVGACSVNFAYTIGKKLDAAEWAAKAVVERFQNPPPTDRAGSSTL